MELLQECDRYYGQWAFVGRCGPRGNWVRSWGHVQFLGCLLCTLAGANAQAVRYACNAGPIRLRSELLTTVLGLSRAVEVVRRTLFKATRSLWFKPRLCELPRPHSL